jgi:hypothetical protein
MTIKGLAGRFTLFNNSYLAVEQPVDSPLEWLVDAVASAQRHEPPSSSPR